MRDRWIFPAIIAAVLLSNAAGCHKQPAIVATFDVQELPPEPPAPPPPPASENRVVPEAEPIRQAPPDPAAILKSISEKLTPIYFDTNRWEINGDASRTIEENGRLLQGATGWTATVEGHADERGTDSWNEALGIWRAKTVKDALRAMGIEPSRMTILSFGKTRPAQTGKDEASLSRNRRVEIILHPSQH